jgi:hypothetical protein
VGRDEIVREWLSHRTPDVSYLASYTPVAIDRLYDSLCILTFADDGRCDELVEWFMLQPTAAESG